MASPPADPRPRARASSKLAAAADQRMSAAGIGDERRGRRDKDEVTTFEEMMSAAAIGDERRGSIKRRPDEEEVAGDELKLSAGIGEERRGSIKRKREEEEVAGDKLEELGTLLSVKAAEVIPSGRGMASPPAEARHRDRANSNIDDMEDLPRARASSKGDDAAATAAGYGVLFEEEKTTASPVGQPRPSCNKRRYQELAGADADESQGPRSAKRQVQKVGAAAQANRGHSDVVRADQILSLPEHVRADLMSRLPYQMALSQINTEPVSLRFHLEEGVYPSPDELTVLLNLPQLIRVKRFSLIVNNDQVTDVHTRGYLTRASNLLTQELHLQYGLSISNPFFFVVASCSTHLTVLSLKNVRIDQASLAITPVFTELAVVRLCSVPVGSLMLTQLLSLCPSLICLSLHDVGLLDVMIDPPASFLTSVRITSCSVISLNLEGVGNLKSLFYTGPLPEMYLNRCAPLEELVICSPDEEYPGDPAFSWLQVGPDLSVLSHLSLSNTCLRLLSSGTASLHLPRLEELQVIFYKLGAKERFEFITFLCGTCCCNLQRMFLQLGKTSNHLEMGQEDPKVDTEINLSSLSLVRVEAFDGSTEQMSLLNCLLRNAEILEHMLLSFSGDEGVLQRKVQFLKQCSESAEVLLIQGDGSWPLPTHQVPSI